MDYETMTKKQLLAEVIELRRQLALQQDPAPPERTQGEQQIQTFQEWEIIFNAIDSAVWLLDDQFHIIRSNTAAENMFHLPIHDMIGKYCWEIIHGTTQPIPQCPTVQAHVSKKRESTELQIASRWFEVVVDVALDASGQVVGYIHIVTDITDRKQAEYRLADSEARYRLLAENADDVIWLWDLATNQYVYVSPSIERLRKFTMEEIVEQSLSEALLPESQWLLTQELPRRVQALESGDETARFQSYEMDQKCKDGSLVPTEVATTFITNTDGRVTHLQGITRNITERRKMEARLKESEGQLRAILEASTESVFLMDKDGYLVTGNKTTADRLHTDIQSMKAKNLFDLLPPAIAESRKRYVQQVIDTCMPVQFEDERFGQTILSSLYPITGENGQVTHVAVFGMDITDEKETRQLIEDHRRKLAEINTMLQQVINTIPARIFWKDKDCIYLGCNKLFAMDSGRMEPDDLIGDNDYNMTWKEQADLYRKDDQEIMTSGIAKINYEEPQTTPEGNQIWLRTTKVPLRDQEGRITGILGTYEDITERKELEKLVQESEERYRTLFQHNQAVMLVIDPESGLIVDANASACKYYGYELSFLIGKPITDINTLSSEEVFEEMARAKAEQRYHFYFKHRLATGEIRHVEVYSGPVALKGKQLLYSIIHDISERRRLEEEKERLIFELRDALSKIKTLSGLLPICASCKKIRDDKGYWQQIESYIRDHSQAEFSHGICPECIKKLYPDLKTDE